MLFGEEEVVLVDADKAEAQPAKADGEKMDTSA